MKSFSHIAVQQFTESKEYTLQTVKTWKITFKAGDYVTFTGDNQTVVVTVDDKTSFSAVNKPKYTLTNNNYTFDGWFKDDDTEMGASEAITSDLTLTAKASAKQVAFDYEAENATIYVTGGVTDGKATYGTPITFTVAPVGNYVIDSVTYTVGNGTPQNLNADNNGVYTIDGSAITGDIKVEVTATQYHTVTFKAGTGVNMTEATAYVKDGQSKLYTDADFDTLFTVPTPTAQTGYRLAKDDATEPLWKDTADNGYQTSVLNQGTNYHFTADTTLTAQAIQQWTVTFQAGDHGTFSSTSVVVDDNTTVPIDKIPTVTAEPGYKFTGWSGDVSAAITADTTFTAQYTDDSYTLTLPDTNGVRFAVDGATLKDGVYTVTHGTDVTITVTANGATINSVSYTIDSTTTDVANFAQPFTIDGDSITGNITVNVQATSTYRITVKVNGGNGTVNGQDEVTLTVDAGTTAEALDDMFTFTPAPGYELGTISPAFANVTGNATYTVTFTDASYRVTWPANENGALPETLTHGKDFIFTPSVTGKLVTGVTYQVGENQVALEPNADGSYTIPGSAITGPITVTYTTVDATWEFISEGDYKAAPVGEKVAILKTSKLGTGTYTLTGYGDMYWSEKYDNGAYVCFVDDDETAATLTQKLATNSNTVIEINYDGKINSDDKVSAADSAPITAVLHQIEVQYDITDLMRFQFDVNGDKAVTTQDIEWILDEAVGNSHTSSNT